MSTSRSSSSNSDSDDNVDAPADAPANDDNDDAPADLVDGIDEIDVTRGTPSNRLLAILESVNLAVTVNHAFLSFVVPGTC